MGEGVGTRTLGVGRDLPLILSYSSLNVEVESGEMSMIYV